MECRVHFHVLYVDLSFTLSLGLFWLIGNLSFPMITQFILELIDLIVKLLSKQILLTWSFDKLNGKLSRSGRCLMYLSFQIARSFSPCWAC